MQPILTINLATKHIDTFQIPAQWSSDYIGAASLAARILFEDLSKDIDPFAPDAPLLFMTGPLTGTAGPAVGRFVVCARSPATGLWGESNCGGFWGPELRKTGFDGLLITGKSESPVYLWINNGQVQFRNAAHLWGQQTYATQESILAEIDQKNPKVAVIGPAGESQIPFAHILTDHGRVAGRTGMGAVMGAKNLKAIAVKGNGKVPVVSDGFGALRSDAKRALREDNMTRAMRELGSAAPADYFHYLGEMPKKYFQSGEFEGIDQISGATMSETILTGVSACHACIIACGRVVKLAGEDFKRKGPEYETVVGFGPNLLVDDLEWITRFGELCDHYGMDTISLSNTIGLALTLFERGLISEADTDGLVLGWGDVEVIEKLVHKTARREGFGDFLAKGARSLAKLFGAPELAVQVNGLEVAYHDPRGASGMALSYVTSPRGACHNQSDYFMADIYGQTESCLGMEFFDRHAGAEKAVNVVIHQNWRTVFNALVICFFANVPPLTVLALTKAATGEDYTLEGLLQVGERAWNLKRIINLKLGLTRQQEKLPKLLLEPYQDGGAVGYQIPFDEMLAAYYAARGWDLETGNPTPEKLNELGLDWVDQVDK